MTKPAARIIAVVALGVVCCAVAMIAAVHHGEDSGPGAGNVTPEGSPTGLNLTVDVEDIKNATPEQVPGEVQGVESMTSEEIWERAQEIYWSWYRSGTVERMLEKANMTPEELPDDVTEEMKKTMQFEDIIRTWDVDPQNKQVVIHAIFAWNEEHEKELNAIQGRKVGDWTFNVVWEPHMLSAVRRALEAANMTPEELPDEVKEEMETISVQIGGIRPWELDPRNRLVVAHAHFTWPNDGYETKVDAIQGREIGGWTFTAILEPDVPKLMQRALDAANMTPDEVPEEVRKELQHLRRGNNRTFSISKWEFDPDNKRVVIYAYSLRDEQGMEAFQGRDIGGWTLTVIHDVDYEKERKQVAAELLQFQKDHPELEIVGCITSPTTIDIWVRNRTPENEILDGTVMYGRTVELLWSPVDYAIRMAREQA